MNCYSSSIKQIVGWDERSESHHANRGVPARIFWELALIVGLLTAFVHLLMAPKQPPEIGN